MLRCHRVKREEQEGAFLKHEDHDADLSIKPIISERRPPVKNDLGQLRLPTAHHKPSEAHVMKRELAEPSFHLKRGYSKASSDRSQHGAVLSGKPRAGPSQAHSSPVFRERSGVVSERRQPVKDDLGKLHLSGGRHPPYEVRVLKREPAETSLHSGRGHSKISSDRPQHSAVLQGEPRAGLSQAPRSSSAFRSTGERSGSAARLVVKRVAVRVPRPNHSIPAARRLPHAQEAVGQQPAAIIGHRFTALHTAEISTRPAPCSDVGEGASRIVELTDSLSSLTDLSDEDGGSTSISSGAFGGHSSDKASSDKSDVISISSKQSKGTAQSQRSTALNRA